MRSPLHTTLYNTENQVAFNIFRVRRSTLSPRGFCLGPGAHAKFDATQQKTLAQITVYMNELAAGKGGPSAINKGDPGLVKNAGGGAQAAARFKAGVLFLTSEGKLDALSRRDFVSELIQQGAAFMSRQV